MKQDTSLTLLYRKYIRIAKIWLRFLHYCTSSHRLAIISSTWKYYHFVELFELCGMRNKPSWSKQLCWRYYRESISELLRFGSASTLLYFCRRLAIIYSTWKYYQVVQLFELYRMRYKPSWSKQLYLSSYRERKSELLKFGWVSTILYF